VLPDYINEYLRAYFEMSSEDRRKILDDRYFDTNPLTCPKEYLPYLAIEVGVNIDGLSESDARASIYESINALNYKGTAKSFKSSLKPFTKAKVKEWYEYNGKPYYFKAVLSPNNTDFRFDKQNYLKLKKIIEENKNVRSVFEGFEFEILLNEQVKTFSGFIFKPKIDKDVELGLEPSQKVNVNEANIFYLSINKDLQKDLNPTEKLSFMQGAISNVSINSTLNLNLKPLTNNTIQGAIIWRGLFFFYHKKE